MKNGKKAEDKRKWEGEREQEVGREQYKTGSKKEDMR